MRFLPRAYLTEPPETPDYEARDWQGWDEADDAYEQARDRAVESGEWDRSRT
jgi:hypothetical protein